MYGKRKLADCWTMIGMYAIGAVVVAFSLAPVFV